MYCTYPFLTWASSLKTVAEPTKLVPSEPITNPTRPAPDAPVDEWIEYHQQMAAVLEWKRDVEQWRGGVETRLESLESVTSIILDRMGPQTLTTEHQRLVQYYVKQLHDATGKAFPTIYDDLKTAFQVPKYSDIPEAEWDKVVKWFKVQIERKGK